jgi:competence protein ComGE
MLRKSDGFFFAEMLLSLAAFIMGTIVILPYAKMVISQTVQIRAETAAIHILYDELMYMKINGMNSERKSVVQQGIFYETRVKTDYPFTEVCIHYNVEHQKENQKCSIVE